MMNLRHPVSIALMLLAALCLFLIGLRAANAQAKMPCAPLDDALSYWFETYGELPTYVGVSDGGSLLMIFVHPQTDDWSLQMTDGDNICVVGGGTGWQPAPDALVDSAKGPPS